MSDTYFLEHVLKNKLPMASEVEVHLFELCNLRCHFCGQDHDDRTGFDSVVLKADKALEFISKSTSKNHIVNIMGGEIFNDELSDDIFNDYLQFAKKINDYVVAKSETCVFNWVSNLIFAKRERVQFFLNSLSAENIQWNISTSYDFTGRKNSLWKKEIFHFNLELFKERIYTIGFVLTKESVAALLKDDDEYFKHLYLHYPLYFDFYVPENGANRLMPSDRDILDAYLFIAKNYPKINPVSDLLKNSQNKMTCYSMNKTTILPDGQEVKCRYMQYDANSFNHEVNYSSNVNIIEAHLEENQCLSCEWFERCSFRCFVQADWAKREKMPECIFKTFFQEVRAWNLL